MSGLLPGDAAGKSSQYAAGDDGVEDVAGSDGPMVMFLRRKYIASEADGNVRVEVIRVGDSSQQCSVYFSTAKISGISSAGADDYVAVKDNEVVFLAGETLQAVDVKLVNSRDCAAMLQEAPSAHVAERAAAEQGASESFGQTDTDTRVY